MGKHREKRVQKHYSKHEGLKKVVIAKRVCIGNRAGNECTKTFQPKSRWNFLCELCNDYIARSCSGE